MRLFNETKQGQIVLGDSLEYMAGVKSGSVDLIATSPLSGSFEKRTTETSKATSTWTGSGPSAASFNESSKHRARL